MKKTALLLCFSAVLFSCQQKKLTEVVEVPLPAAEEKMTIGKPEDVSADAGAFEMYKLPFQYDALAPNLDAMTMEMHYGRHYLTYTNNLNRLIDSTEFAKLPIEEIFRKLNMSDADLRNNLGGYYNHTLYFETLKAKGESEPKDTLAAAIKRDFGSFDLFKTKFEDVAERQFGSGWAWLVTDKAGKLQVISTPNQDNPLMPGMPVKGTPILALDVWEHAYYLGYQFRRKKYIANFFNIVNWDKVSERYENAIKK
ncbi:superoxide dismutase [Flavobacterium sp. MAH-1]|uniref:Superoxide dismutase n=1 Tax=Flavobacterium agri TaxID=2743471 RepID=A0A7Y8Y597_9FLAO|nr:superoxide dismutase [Flavobacterium agri]NUY82124.1 superoxide dismutase [Flavobacterium agri]NYA72148.1 superoxide dismutase [Flavobacterium agri]